MGFRFSRTLEIVQVLAKQKRRFAALLQKPSDGLEPSTPSLPWRLGPTAADRPRAARRLVFPASTRFSLPGLPLPWRSLSDPENPRTCPQDLSPDPRPVKGGWHPW